MWQAILPLGVAVFGVLGVVIAAGVTGLFAIRQAQLGTQREYHLRQIEWWQARKDAHDVFQREAIIALQDALRVYWGLIVDVNIQIHGPEGAKPAGVTLETVFAQMRASYSPVRAARAKVFDDELRRLVTEFDFQAALATSLNAQDARKGMTACYERLVDVEERVNFLLRQLF